jgi:RNA-directed DNA polymerase
VVDLDLAKFFDRVHHQRLLARIAERVKDQRIISLVRLMLTASVVMPDGTRVAVKEGTPQGGPLSPLLSNVVLNELDGELARRGLRFVRFATGSIRKQKPWLCLPTRNRCSTRSKILTPTWSRPAIA